jgi:hypothetical protein
MVPADCDLDIILAQLVDANGICRVYSQSHSFRPDFENVKTSMDNISALFRRRLLNI